VTFVEIKVTWSWFEKFDWTGENNLIISVVSKTLNAWGLSVYPWKIPGSELLSKLPL